MMKLFRTLTVLMLLCATAVYARPTAAAPAPAAMAAPAAGPAVAVPPAGPAMTPEEMNKPFTDSFFLTTLEITAINQALSGRLTKNQTLQTATAPIPPHRVIRISGVLYRSPMDWVVWNNKKVTPDELLPQIIDISVKPSSKVSLKWYDAGLDQVLSITLRPHETYDITTGILLPK